MYRSCRCDMLLFGFGRRSFPNCFDDGAKLESDSHSCIMSLSPNKPTDELELAARTPLPSSRSTLALNQGDFLSTSSMMLNESSLAPVDGGAKAYSFVITRSFCALQAA